MKHLFKSALVAAIVFLIVAAPADARKVTHEEAINVARKWVQLTILQDGTWGGSTTAEVTGVEDLKRKGKPVGYFCPVSPVGYIVVSLHRELAPIKAYSDTHNLDPTSEQGMSDLIKGGMDGVLTGLENKLGRIESRSRQDIEKELDIKYGAVWDELESGALLSSVTPMVGETTGNYQQGQILLTSAWSQGDPYNRDCPPASGCAHTLVGCVATAGAQIMRYWNWPPYGVRSPYNDTYDWVNMPDRVSSSSTAAEIAAVAEISREVGLAVGMNYGCELSTADNSNMVGVFENQFRYHTDCDYYYRILRTADQWWAMYKEQINLNRPVQYRVVGHAIVGDGWRETGQTPLRQYHMNYGWDTNHNTWYTMDELHLGDPWQEHMVMNIVPAVFVGVSPAGTYSKQAFPYRYFDQDVACITAASFEAGQYMQCLPNIRLRCYAPGMMWFRGSSSDSSYIYTRGDTSKGIRVRGGALRISNGGGLVLR